MKQTLLVVMVTVGLVGCNDLTLDQASRPVRGEPRVVRAPAPVTCPDGWTTKDQATGVVQCTRRTSAKASRDDVLILIDFSRGAQILNVTDGVTAASPQSPSPQFRKHWMSTWWDWQSTAPRRFCVVNGGWFQNTSQLAGTTQLSFPVKSNNRLVTTGARTDGPSLRMLAFGGGQASVSVYQQKGNDFATVSKLVPGLSAVMGYGMSAGDDGTDRTYIGVMDRNADHQNDALAVYLTFNSQWQRATAFMISLGVLDAVQLDGGHSTQFWCKKDHSKDLLRALPHTLAIYSGT